MGGAGRLRLMYKLEVWFHVSSWMFAGSRNENLLYLWCTSYVTKPIHTPVFTHNLQQISLWSGLRREYCPLWQIRLRHREGKWLPLISHVAFSQSQGQRLLVSVGHTPVTWGWSLQCPKSRSFLTSRFLLRRPAGALHFNGPRMLTACKEVRFGNGQPDGEAFWTFPGAGWGCCCPWLLLPSPWNGFQRLRC